MTGSGAAHMGSSAMSAGVKQTERESDHSPTSSAEVKNEWSFIYFLPYVFMVVFRHRGDILTILLLLLLIIIIIIIIR
jgi:hypothetical protein